MKLKWFKKKFTFMVIPDNDPGRSVLRFRIHGLLLYIFFFVFAASMIISLILYIAHGKSSILNSMLAKKLSGQEQEYTHTVTSKDMTIEQLQNKVIQLSEQATEIKSKIGEMQKLDNEVKQLTNPDKPAKKKTNIGAEVVQDGSNQAQGGPIIPVSDEEIFRLADTTQANFETLGNQMTTLFGTLEQTKKKVIDSIQLLKITPTIWPVNTRHITSSFGYRKDPFTYRPTYHSGFDIAGDFDDPVYVTADGTVISSGYDNLHGNNIVVSHTRGLRTWYMHLNKSLVSEGDHVNKGDKIGLLGSTGRSTGSHLHYEVKKDGVSVDPGPYLITSRKEE
ncbi:MAG: peptidoglycan DD-metalloendopeptidase family protein [Paenibacillaceae bacterium]